MTLQESNPNWSEELFQKILKKFPPRIQHDLQNLSFPSELFEIDTSKGIYFYGNNGVGKTIRASMLLASIVKKNYLLSSIFFISTLDLFEKLRIGVLNDDDSFFEFVCEIPFLCIDDIGVEKPTEWVYQKLYHLVNTRYENLLPIIFTSNLDLIELTKKWGDSRIPSRIQGSCQIIKISGIDFRSKI